MQNERPDWKRTWLEWSKVYSKCLQMAVRRIKHGETVLDSLKERGFDVGELKWKPPREYRSITYNQSGFDVDSNTGRTDHAVVTLSKIGTFHVTFHRPLPSNGEIKDVVLKKQKTGDWTVSIMVEYDADYAEKPAVEDIDVEDTVGIDLGIVKFIHDSGGRAVAPLDESVDRERIENRHRALSRKTGTKRGNGWRGRTSERLSNKRRAYHDALANAYTKQYDAVFLEDRNVASMSWYQTVQTFERFGEKNGVTLSSFA